MRGLRRRLRDARGLPFILPYLPFLIAFGIAPMIYALDLAFTHVNGEWAGFQDFVRSFNDYRFVPAFQHVFLYTGVWLGTLIIFVVGLALLLHGRANRVSSSYRFLFYMPGALAGAASVLVWLFMLDPVVSPGSFLLDHVLGAHLFAESIAPGHLPFIFAMIAFWTGAGGWIVVMYGALNTIPPDLEEAARIDGAGPLTIALRLKLPLIRKWIAYMVILSFATGTQLFVEPQIVNQASLGLVPDTWSPNQLAYQMAFRYGDFNTTSSQYPIQVGLSDLLSSTPSFNPAAGGGGQQVNIFRPELALATLLAILPVLLVFLFAQRFLVRGLLQGANKE